jgi:hypothetical protein
MCATIGRRGPSGERTLKPGCIPVSPGRRSGGRALPLPAPTPAFYTTRPDAAAIIGVHETGVGPKLVKSPDSYLGDGFLLWACISQFDAATGPDSFRGQASYKNQAYWYSDGDNALFTGDEAKLADFVADDIVYMKVVSLGSFSYDTQNGGNTTVPLFDVVTIKRKGGC